MSGLRADEAGDGGRSAISGRPVISAVELATRLGIPAPTEQQIVVIEAPLAPALVIAGAGSGKTETMAARVLWLVANGLVAPEEVLGLTFTRKAAASLATRIGTRLAALREAGLMPDHAEHSAHGASAEAMAGQGIDAFAEPTVSTYNAFASALTREHALAIGREPDAEVIGDAAAWQLARRVVIEHGDRRLVRLDRSVDRIATIVLDLSRAIADNTAEVADIRAMAHRFLAIGELPIGGRGKSTPYKSVVDAIDDVAALDPLLDLVGEYAAAKRRRGVVEFSDQVALALQVSERSPGAVELARERHRVVLLDEYQDTSVVQTRLLSRLFRGMPVMAVGDPNQSIYGWRGASAANLTRFGADFGGGAADAPVPEHQLSTSWRNAAVVLDAANVVVEPLRIASSVEVAALDARPAAPPGDLGLRFDETIDDEAATVAAWCRDRLAEPGASGRQRDAAILFRRRAPMARFAQALADLGVPHVVVGLGGLLETPEVTDVLCALRVLVDPDAGSELIRLLAGPEWRIGVRDLAELGRVAAWLHDRDWAHRPLSPEVVERRRESAAADDGRSIVDALDFVADASAGHSMLEGFSEIGLARLRDAGLRFRALRLRTGLSLPELVRIVEQELRLDLETAANERSAVGTGNLRAFHDELDAFIRVDDRATVSSLLAWVDRAREKEALAPAEVDPEPGAVQLLTIHASKGLEWDAVAVPRLVEGELPNASTVGTGWIGVGRLPDEFRGDAGELPVLAWRSASTQQEFDVALKAYVAELKARAEQEERRLAYVALTRAKDDLLLTGSFWGGQTRPRGPSPYVLELAAAHLIPTPPEAPTGEAPDGSTAEELPWPRDPLGMRRDVVESAASAVSVVAAAGGAVSAAGRPPWAADLELLLAERAAAEVAAPAVLPDRIPASGFKDWIEDAEGVRSRLRRPMPERPIRATRIGTRFHSWVEGRYGTAPAGDLVDAADDELDLPGEGDRWTGAGASGRPDDDADAQLARLQAAFERSEWANLAPEAIEVELHLPFAGRTIVCRIDAVFRRGERWQVVDWKTGRAPRDAAELRRRELQLALYRLAWANRVGVAPEEVDVAFFFVADERVVVPDRVLDEAELLRRWQAAVGPRPGRRAGPPEATGPKRP